MHSTSYFPSARPPLVPLLLLLLGISGLATAASAQDLQLHPQNPHYFLWRGKPTVLITSGEHYGAVLNLDFNYTRYLDTLAADGLNLTRTFAGGAYFEPQGSFSIAHNTLAPAPGRFIAPWARSQTPGFAGGGNKFDLDHWNPAYFARLKDFVGAASRRGVVVEMNLFCPFYDESQWKLSPFNASNNVNGIGHVPRTNVYTLTANGGLLAYQEKMVREIVAALEPFDNVYYEICNEPYFGGVTADWQRHIAEVIASAQSGSAHPKLISQNVANRSARISNPPPQVSIFNFHYASPPETVAWNYGLNKVIGDNETGFRGTNDLPYRIEAWEFILAGGGLFNNLDYSFTVGHEDGTFVYPATQPGGGNPAFRKQVHVLRDFINAFDFIAMKPDPACVEHRSPENLHVHVLDQPGKAYALYLRREKPGTTEQAKITLRLPPGEYTAEWLSPTSGEVMKSEHLRATDTPATLDAPAFADDIAIRIRRE